MSKSAVIILFVMVIIGFQEVGADTEIDKAKKFFEKCIELEKAFDPSIADLYSDDAVITSRRIFPNGFIRYYKFDTKKYKALMRSIMPLAKLRGDCNEYSEITYAIEGKHVRIKCTRYSKLKRYYSPYELLVGPAKSGEWLIFEEKSETRP